MEVVSLYKIGLRPKGPKMDVLIMQALVFNKMEIRPCDAAVYIDHQAVEYSIFSHYHTSLPMEVGSMYQIVLRPEGPKWVTKITDLCFNKMEIHTWDPVG